MGAFKLALFTELSEKLHETEIIVPWNFEASIFYYVDLTTDHAALSVKLSTKMDGEIFAGKIQ